MIRATTDTMDTEVPFALRVCVGGQKLEAKEAENVRIWRDKALHF
jgi:hypothetical protein